MVRAIYLLFFRGAPGRIRTADTRFRRAVLYPLSYEGLQKDILAHRAMQHRHEPKVAPRSRKHRAFTLARTAVICHTIFRRMTSEIASGDSAGATRERYLDSW